MKLLLKKLYFFFSLFLQFLLSLSLLFLCVMCRVRLFFCLATISVLYAIVFYYVQ
jgi:hypothetical protein